MFHVFVFLYSYINHNLYWATISPNVQGEHRLPSGTILKDITKKYGSFSEFKSTFTDMATNYFGSGMYADYQFSPLTIFICSFMYECIVCT